LRNEFRLKVFDNSVLRKIFGPKRHKKTRQWTRLHNKELYDLHSSPNNILIIKSRRMKWVGHVVRMGDRTNAYRVLVRRPDGKRPLGNLGVGGIILKWMFKKYEGEIGSGLIWLRIGTGGGRL
jgi:hypothetical protein